MARKRRARLEPCIRVASVRLRERSTDSCRQARVPATATRRAQCKYPSQIPKPKAGGGCWVVVVLSCHFETCPKRGGEISPTWMETDGEFVLGACIFTVVKGAESPPCSPIQALLLLRSFSFSLWPRGWGGQRSKGVGGVSELQGEPGKGMTTTSGPQHRDHGSRSTKKKDARERNVLQMQAYAESGLKLDTLPCEKKKGGTRKGERQYRQMKQFSRDCL